MKAPNLTQDLIQRLETQIQGMLLAARIPGAALAIVPRDGSAVLRTFGSRDLEAKLPLDMDARYPIGSTTKALNATLLGMLVDEGVLGWDVPLRQYLPQFRLADPLASERSTLRDLVTMRTGLPRHDYVWVESRLTRAELPGRLPYLQLSADFRERFQYNNLTPTLAGHIAELVTGQPWEELLQRRLLDPLGMRFTGFSSAGANDVVVGYHEDSRRRLLQTRPLTAQVVAPAGGSIHSTVDDMARWVAFNLNGGEHAGTQLIARQCLSEIHSPQVVAGADPAAPSRRASYGLGWFVDTYNGRLRISHTGQLNDVHSCVTLFPDDAVGMVSFTNFASLRLAPLINQYAFDLIMDLAPAETFEQKLQEYELKVAENLHRRSSVPRISCTAPSHDLDAYAGTYVHAGYGAVEVIRHEDGLRLQRQDFSVDLEHWHYDAWVAMQNDQFEIHKPHAFDRMSRLLFETDAAGEIEALLLPLEPAVGPIRFVRNGDV